jgi:hypothetical protein
MGGNLQNINSIFGVAFHSFNGSRLDIECPISETTFKGWILHHLNGILDASRGNGG